MFLKKQIFWQVSETILETGRQYYKTIGHFFLERMKKRGSNDWRKEEIAQDWLVEIKHKNIKYRCTNGLRRRSTPTTWSDGEERGREVMRLGSPPAVPHAPPFSVS